MTDNGDLNSTSGLVLFIGSDVVGRSEDYQLGSLLMQTFLHTISGHRIKPETVLLMNNGVKLAVQDSLALGELRQLENQGVEILACGTCLSRFQLTDKVAVGQVSNMADITDTMLKAVKVISI
ncbi:sulfurtransferase-like selenium metabolism protein YedF [Chloroflexota bacterium]